MYILVIASLSVAIVVFIIYALERKTKNEPIQWDTALKVSMVGGLITAGVVFSTTAETIKEIATTGGSEVVNTLAQEMFVGVPTF